MKDLDAFIKEFCKSESNAFICFDPIDCRIVFYLWHLNSLLIGNKNKMIFPIKLETDKSNKNNRSVTAVYNKRDFNESVFSDIEKHKNINIKSIQEKFVELTITNNDSVK